MKSGTPKDDNAVSFALPWWFLPAFIAGGQLLMRTTGYTAWAAEVGQEFMLTIMFYMSLLGPVMATSLYVSLRKYQRRGVTG